MSGLKSQDVKNPFEPETELETPSPTLNKIEDYSKEQVEHIGRLAPIRYCTNPEVYLADAAADWLVRDFGEGEEPYKTRVSKALSSFEPYYSYLKGLIVGTALRKEPYIPEDIDEIWKEFFKNVDLKGTGFKAFAKQLLSEAIDGGCIGLWTEYPVSEEGLNAEEEKARGYRPYFMIIKSVDILEATPKVVTVEKNGQKRIKVVTDYLRIKFFHVEPQEDGKDKTYPGIMEYLGNKTNKDGKPAVEWVRYVNRTGIFEEDERGFLTKATIPVELIYGGPVEAHAVGRPLLLDIARLNLRHWATSADLDNIIHETAASIPYATGVRSDERVARNSANILTIENPNAKVGYMSSGMEGADIILRRLEKLEAAMERLATVAMTVGKTQAESGYSKLLDRAQSDSQLATIVEILEDSMNCGIEHAAEYYEKDPVEVKLNRDFVPVKLHSQQIQAYIQCFEADAFDIETFLEILNAGDVFEGIPDFSVKKLLKKMGLKGGERASQLGVGRDKLTVGKTAGAPPEGNKEPLEGLGAMA